MFVLTMQLLGANQVRVIVEENGCSFSQNMVINVYPLLLWIPNSWTDLCQ
ncbi:MAG: hypothetical protein R2769_08000 [Saprospiraceae bacterium]